MGVSYSSFRFACECIPNHIWVHPYLYGRIFKRNTLCLGGTPNTSMILKKFKELFGFFMFLNLKNTFNTVKNCLTLLASKNQLIRFS